MSWFEYPLMFCFAFTLDALCVLYYRAVHHSFALKAAVLAMAISGVSYITVLPTIPNPWLVIPSILGHGAGTYCSVKFIKKRTESY